MMMLRRRRVVLFVLILLLLLLLLVVLVFVFLFGRQALTKLIGLSFVFVLLFVHFKHHG